MNRKTALEWVYLLGDFGVNVAGAHARITAPVKTLTWGDWTTQGLPFYGANVTYHCNLDASKLPTGNLALESLYSGPLVDVAIDGEAPQPVAFAPYRAKLGNARHKKFTVDITAYGNRANAFACLHNANRHLVLFDSPASYRSTGENWAYEYRLRPMGVLTAPIIKQELPRSPAGPAIPDPRSAPVASASRP